MLFSKIQIKHKYTININILKNILVLDLVIPACI